MTSREAHYRPHVAKALERLAEAQRALIQAEAELDEVNVIRADILGTCSERWEFPELDVASAAVERARMAVAEHLPLGTVI